MLIVTIGWHFIKSRYSIESHGTVLKIMELWLKCHSTVLTPRTLNAKPSQTIKIAIYIL